MADLEAGEGGPGTAASPTRLVAMGSRPLIEGFHLLGFETWPDATPAQLEGLLEELERHRDKAFVVLEQGLAREPGPWLKRAYAQGGRIVITEVPPLNAPAEYRSHAEEAVLKVLGANALDESS